WGRSSLASSAVATHRPGNHRSSTYRRSREGADIAHEGVPFAAQPADGSQGIGIDQKAVGQTRKTLTEADGSHFPDDENVPTVSQLELLLESALQHCRAVSDVRGGHRLRLRHRHPGDGELIDFGWVLTGALVHRLQVPFGDDVDAEIVRFLDVAQRVLDDAPAAADRDPDQKGRGGERGEVAERSEVRD